MKEKKRNRGYAAKRASGNMMYGPGCCAHNRVITPADRERFATLRFENERPASRPWVSRTDLR